jgi:hypothetical protein
MTTLLTQLDSVLGELADEVRRSLPESGTGICWSERLRVWSGDI